MMTTVTDLTSQLRQMISKEGKYHKEVGNLNMFCSSSSRPVQLDVTRQSESMLEAASRLVGEVHMAEAGAKSLGTSWNDNVLMKAGLPAFPVENYDEKESQKKFEGKSQETSSSHIRAEDEGETAVEEGDGGTGLERGKNPVCLLQELLVANNATHLPKYHLVGEYGPGHSKIFTVTNTV